jgi:hypothetical protein
VIHLFDVTFNCICMNCNNLSGFSQSSSHGGQSCNRFKGYALSHKGKATSDVQYNPEDGPEAYSNPSVHSRLTEYTAMARQVHGPDFDPATEELDTEVVMRIGGGKKNGRYYMCDGAIDPSSTPTLSQIRARSTSGSPAIRPRPSGSLSQINQLQVVLPLYIVFFIVLHISSFANLIHSVKCIQTQLEEEKRRRAEEVAEVKAQLMAQMEERMRLENEERMRADQQRMEAWMAYMQSFSVAAGVPLPPPPMMFTSPPPFIDPLSTPVSAFFFCFVICYVCTLISYVWTFSSLMCRMLRRQPQTRLSFLHRPGTRRQLSDD